MLALSYTISLAQPVLLTALVSDPSSSISLNYLPGSALRGVFLKHYLQQQQRQDGRGDDRFRRVFLNSAVRFLNAYPHSQDQQRSLPVPRALQKAKHPRSDTPDSTIVNGCQSGEAGAPQQSGERLVYLREPFCMVRSTTIELIEPRYTLDLHIQRNRVRGRALPEDGALFQYQALDTGQSFQGVILVDDNEQRGEVAHCCKAHTGWIGRSRSAEYGQVMIHDLQWHEHWEEVAVLQKDTGETWWTLTLLSDALLRNSEGTILTYLDDATLSAYLGTPVAIDTEYTFTWPTRVGGFNRYWSMPLMQPPALAAGSVITFLSQTPLSSSHIQHLTAQGIGERRAEGFGRIAFNWMTAPVYTLATEEDLDQPSSTAHPVQEASEVTPPSVTLSPLSQALAQRMARQQDMRYLDDCIAAYIQRHVQPVVNDMPENSQLARLGTLVRQARATGDVAAVQTAVKRFRSPARQAYQQVDLDGMVFWDWITSLLDNPALVWERLGMTTMPDVVGQQSDPRPLHENHEAINRAALQLLAALLVAPARLRKNRME